MLLKWLRKRRLEEARLAFEAGRRQGKKECLERLKDPRFGPDMCARTLGMHLTRPTANPRLDLYEFLFKVILYTNFQPNTMAGHLHSAATTMRNKTQSDGPGKKESAQKT